MPAEPRLVMAVVTDPDGSVESEGLFVADDGDTLTIELPNGAVVQVADREFDHARGRAA